MSITFKQTSMLENFTLQLTDEKLAVVLHF